MDEMLHEILVQVPNLAVLATIVFWFLKALHRLLDDIRDLGNAVRTLNEHLERTGQNTCRFHDQFEETLKRIEKAVSK